MKGALRIGKLSGIGVFIHWTFLFILLYIAFKVMDAGGDIWAIVRGEIFLLLIYLCVVLHEMGHALAARKYGVSTLHIVLYPIGGIASLERIPEKPFEEFVVAIAGPLVNVGIAMGLGLYLFLFAGNASFEENATPTFVTMLDTFDKFIFTLMWTNLILVGFNIIPAFPMDGGRVLRALLSIKIGRVKATQIASVIGQVFAILFVAFGFLTTPFQPFIVLIGVFVYIAAMGENRMVYTESKLSGFKVQDVMRTKFVTLNGSDSLGEAVKLLLANAEDSFIVLEENKPIGVLFRKNLMEAIKSEQMATIADIAVRKIPFLSPDQDIQEVFQFMQRSRVDILPVVNQLSQLIGVLDRRNLNDFIAVQCTTKNR